MARQHQFTYKEYDWSVQAASGKQFSCTHWPVTMLIGVGLITLQRKPKVGRLLSGQKYLPLFL